MTQAQTHSRRAASSATDQRSALVTVTVLYLAVHAMWILMPLFVENDDIPTGAFFVTWTSLALGVVALAGLWRNQRWAWWMLLVITIVNIILTVPEVAGMEGTYRVGSIAALIAQVVMLVLLVRPPLRQRRG